MTRLLSTELPGIGPVLDPGLSRRSTGPVRSSGSTLHRPIGMDEIETLMQRAASLGSAGAQARGRGEGTVAEGYFRDALGLAVAAVKRAPEGAFNPVRLKLLRTAALLALDCGEAAQARGFVAEALASDPSAAGSEEWAQLRDVTAWSDTWLIAAVRRDPPDEAALDTLVDRYWKPLFGRCQMLTVNSQRANDLAQEAWCRVLRARHMLKPEGNFPAYLAMVATNLWRDAHRSARRAGPLADDRLASLDAALPGDEGESVILADVLPDLNALHAEDRTLLKLDLDRTLEQLAPLLRDVLVARFLTGESCAEIGRRYGRTEQSVSGWVREAIRQMKLQLEEREQTVARRDET